MGCSPPSSWYEDQHRANIERQRREHEQRVGQLLATVDGMSPAQRRHLRALLDGDDASDGPAPRRAAS